MKQLHGLFAIAKLLVRTTTTQLLYGDAHIDVSTVMKVAWRLLYEASSLLRVYVERNVNGGLQVLLDEDGDSSTRQRRVETSGLMWLMLQLHWERQGVSQVKTQVSVSF